MSKYFKPSELGQYISKKQGDQKDAAFALSVGLTRQSLRALKTGNHIPRLKTLSALGLEVFYREADPGAPPPSIPGKAVAKKAAKKK